MTTEEIRMAESLDKCTFLPGSFDKRFARDMTSIARNNPAYPITGRQQTCLRLMVYRYRRQIKDVGIIPSQEEAAKLKGTIKAYR